MAVEFANDTTKRADNVYSDYPENIMLEPELNGRHTHTDVESLAEDIRENGQHTPVICRKNDDGLPVLVAGHRRYRAIVLLNERYPDDAKRKVRLVYRKSMSDFEAFKVTISENRFRKDVSPMDDCLNIGIFQTKFGLTLSDIAQIYFPEAKTDLEKAAGVRFVEQRAALAELAPEAADAVRQGRVKITAAVALSKLSKAQQREKVKGEGRIKGKDLKPVVEDAPAPLPKTAPPLVNNKIVVAAKALFKDDLTLRDLQCEDNEWLSVSREKMQKLYLALDGKVAW